MLQCEPCPAIKAGRGGDAPGATLNQWGIAVDERFPFHSMWGNSQPHL